MKTLIVVIIILLAVLSTPLSLKKLIDRSKTNKAVVPHKDELKEWLEDPIQTNQRESKK